MHNHIILIFNFQVGNVECAHGLDRLHHGGIYFRSALRRPQFVT